MTVLSVSHFGPSCQSVTYDSLVRQAVSQSISYFETLASQSLWPLESVSQTLCSFLSVTLGTLVSLTLCSLLSVSHFRHSCQLLSHFVPTCQSLWALLPVSHFVPSCQSLWALLPVSHFVPSCRPDTLFPLVSMCSWVWKRFIKLSRHFTECAPLLHAIKQLIVFELQSTAVGFLPCPG